MDARVYRAAAPSGETAHRAPSRHAVAVLACLCLCLGLATAAMAGEALEVTVRDHDGAPVSGAVVSVHGLAAQPEAEPDRQAVIEQVGARFVPDVLVVRTGTAVRFPNLDRIRHHVYSFSPARRFELPLYSGEAHAPVVFDVPGVVVLGCNIHDWMLGYVVVLDTPWHARSGEDGVARIPAPPAEATVQVWHRSMAPDAEPVRVVLDGTGGWPDIEVGIDLSTPPVVRSRGDAR